PVKVHAAYDAAFRHRGSPSVILAQTIKGFGLGEAGQARNMTHKQKSLVASELRAFSRFFGVDVPAEAIEGPRFLNPGPESEDVRYLLERRRSLGGPYHSFPTSGLPRIE